MKAIILAAGRGTRVQPITYAVPKPMIPILNKPIMEFLIQLLKSHGVRQIMVNTSYRADAIETYFRDGSRFGVDMAYSFEGRSEKGHLIDEPIGSAGALKKIQEQWGFFDETFVVLCGDALVDIDLTRLYRFHKEKGALATLALAGVAKNRVSSYGIAVTDESGRILEFQEKPSVAEARSTTANTGIYIFEPEIIDRIPHGKVYDIGGELFPSLVSTGAALFGANLPFQWLDIGKVSDYYRVVQHVLRGGVANVPVPGRPVAEGIWCGLNTRIDLSHHTIVPPVYIGSGTRLEAGCTVIGPTAIGSGCTVESGAHIEKSLIFDYTRVGACAQVVGKILCDGYCVDPSGTTVDLSEIDMEWAIADARSSKGPPREEQRMLEALLHREKAPTNHRPRGVYAA